MTSATELDWGWHYLMAPPDHFRIDYAINPFMRLADQPDPVRARGQWQAIRDAIEDAGGRVDVLPLPDGAEALPDLIYAMNLGLPLIDRDGRETVMLSHMRYAERRRESDLAADYFTSRGARVRRFGRDGVGAHFEAGDAFAWRGELVLGFGQRSEELAGKHLAVDLDVNVQRIRITHPAMYHLDLSFCPLDEVHAMVCPAAYDEASAAALLRLIPEPLVLSEDEAMTFCANSIVIGKTVIMPACPDRVRAQLEDWGFSVVIVDVSEFLLGGGAIRCLTNPLDVTLDRDLR